MSHATIKKLQTFIYIYIIVIGRGGQSLKNGGSLSPVIGHPLFRTWISICLLKLSSLYIHDTYLLNESQGSSNKNGATTMP